MIPFAPLIILLHEKDIGSPVSFFVLSLSSFSWQSVKISAKESCLYGIISIRIQIDERLNMKNEILLINVLIETCMVEIYLDRRE